MKLLNLKRIRMNDVDFDLLFSNYLSKIVNLKLCNKSIAMKSKVFDPDEFSYDEMEMYIKHDLRIMKSIYYDVLNIRENHNYKINFKTIDFIIEDEKFDPVNEYLFLYMYLNYNNDFGSMIFGSGVAKVADNCYLWAPVVEQDIALNEIKYFLNEHNK